MDARDIVDKFGGQSALAALVGRRQSTVAYWVKTGMIPAKWQSHLLGLAQERGLELSHSDFIVPSIGIKTLPASLKRNTNNTLANISPSTGTTAAQSILDLGIDKQIERDGIGMGVLTDGTAFLTGRGLARLAGVHHSQIQDIEKEYEALDAPPRGTRVREILQSHGVNMQRIYIPIQQRSGTNFAYPDVVCVAILEYYAFEAAVKPPEAIKNYRLLAGRALRDFIYTQVGYDPNNNVPAKWKQFHDRVSLTYNLVPQGYFGIFKEIADMIVTLGNAGLHIDANFVPDISVGLTWARYWNEKGFDTQFGERKKFDHYYPSYFPASASNPQDVWCYPEESLGEFRKWMREKYIGEGRFQKYIEDKVKQKQLPVSFAQLAIAAYRE
jgi:hypothetical protein